MCVPKYLYHYTNIDTLELIMKHRTIRLTSLANVDDLDEVKTSDMGMLGKYCFVSCWTDDEKESIPLWTMYTKDTQGIRIKLDSDMFPKYKVNNTEDDGFFYSYFRIEDILREKSMIIPDWQNLLEKVEYTDDRNLLYPKVASSEGNSVWVKFSEIGKHKSSEWSFQNEWRFIMKIIPVSYEELHHSSDASILLDRLLNNVDLEINSYDLHLKEDVFNNMVITLGPYITFDGRKKVESLVAKLNPMAKIESSVLTGRIRSK